MTPKRKLKQNIENPKRLFYNKLIMYFVRSSMKVSFYTLGCKVNQYESRSLSELLNKFGYETVGKDESADVYIINSCTVTAESDRKTRQAVRRFKRNNPNAVVVLTGCMPQAYPKDAEALVQADIVIGNKSNGELPEILEEFFRNRKRTVLTSQHEKGEAFSSCSVSSFDERTRAYVKIQDGCNRFCSYCIIPVARGRVRSKPLGALKTELEKLSAAGYKEIVLVGINLSAYGQDLDEKFCDAVELACSVEGIERVRLGSLEPDHLTKEVIERLSKCKKLCPQFHISLQSGCDKTLRRMNRHYTADEYRSLCRSLRSCFNDCTLTTDVMVGFCGESDEDFEESLRFVREIGFEKVHVFPYSVRVGTKAEKMDGHLPKSVKEKRAAIMSEECEKMRESFLRSQIGRTVNVLFESKEKDGMILGHTANYTPVKAKGGHELFGKFANVKITGTGDDCCVGEIES